MYYIDKNSLILTSKTSTNLNKYLNEKKFSNEKLLIENKKPKDFVKEGNTNILTKINNNIMNDLNNIDNINNDYYKTALTFRTLNNYKDKKMIILLIHLKEILIYFVKQHYTTQQTTILKKL